MGCGKSVPVREAEAGGQEPKQEQRKQPIADGGTLSPGKQSEANPNLAGGRQQPQIVGGGVLPEANVSQPAIVADGESLRVWICFQDTGKRTIFGLLEKDTFTHPTCAEFASLLMSPAHAGRLRQLGFSGDDLCILTAEGLPRRRTSTITIDDLRACQDRDHPLMTGTTHRPIRTDSNGTAQVNDQGSDSPTGHPTTARPKGTVSADQDALNESVESRASSTSGMSPAQIVQKAEIEQIKSKYLGTKQDSTHKLRLYTSSEQIPEIKRDMQSHLKLKEASPGSGAAPTEERTRLRAQYNPSQVTRARQGSTAIDLDQRNLLLGQLDGFALKHRGTDREQLLENLRTVMSAASWKKLAEEASTGKAGGAWAGEECLEWLCGYVDFARHHGLGNNSKTLELELREELDPYYPSHIWSSPPARKAYALIPLEWSLLGSLQGCSLTYFLDDTPGSGTLSRWASGRLLNAELAAAWPGAQATRPLFGFCGQLPGLSKQALVCEQGREVEGSREEVLGRCQPDDPDEYPRAAARASESRAEFLVQIRHGVSTEVTALVDAKVVLDAAVLLGGDEGDGAGWTTIEGLGAGSVPGYTRGGQGVVLMRSGQLKVSSVEALREMGVTCSALPAA